MDGSAVEIVATELPLVGSFVVIIGGVIFLAWVILGVHERSLERHDRKDNDGQDRD